MVGLFGTLYAIVSWIWVQYLPGYMLSRAVVPDARGMARHGLAMLCSFSTVPLATFLLTVAAGVPMDAPLLFLIATLVNGAGAFLIQPWRDPQISRKDCAMLSAACLAVAVYVVFCIRSLDGGDVFSTVHHCLYVIVMHTVVNDPSVALPLYDGISNDLMYYLVHHPTTEFNGLAPLFFEQRLGNAAILAPSVALFGTAGWFIATVFASVATGLFVYLSGREVGARPWVALLTAVLFVVGMRSFCMYFVNENNYAVALVAFLLWACLRNDVRWGWMILIGLTAGHLVGVRYTSSLFWPAIAVALIWHSDPWKQRLKRFAVAGGLALLTLLPWLYVNFIMLGSAVTHPKVHSEYASRIVTNTLWGWEFEFRALNWPFRDTIARTAWPPFPTFLWLPLQVGVSFGQLMVAIALFGWTRLLRDRRVLTLLLLFAVPHSAAISLMETLDWEQLTYAAPGLVPLAVAFAMGAEALLLGPWKRSLVIVVSLLLMVFAGSWAVRNSQWPVDERPLLAEHWVASPVPDKGVEAVAVALTSFHPLPRIPAVRTGFATVTWRAFEALVSDQTPDTVAALPVYPSGQVALLAGYASERAMDYEFVLQGEKLRTADTPVRTSLGLHQVSLQLPSTQLYVRVIRDHGQYEVRVRPVGEPSPPQDFTLFLHPWNPPVQSIRVVRDSENLDEEAIRPSVASFRLLSYGGRLEDNEKRFIATNYPADVLDVIELSYTVDRNGEPPNGGLFVFLYGVDERLVETLVLAGGHDQSWQPGPVLCATGEGVQHLSVVDCAAQRGSWSQAVGDKGTFRVPRNLLADRVLLYSEPYSSDHVPQPGDRYGVVKGPFDAETPLHFVLDQQW